jgi:hypothetical protein
MLSAIMVNVLAPKAAAVKVGFLIPAAAAFTKLSLLVTYRGKLVCLTPKSISSFVLY